jgi:putative hydrolase
MKTWEKYADYLCNGEWHIHTKYTDGKNNILEYCKKAEDLNIGLIAFTEHVRKNLDYDFDQFLMDIETSRDEFDLIILSGCEAKVLANGDLDVHEFILNKIDYPVFAFHSFPIDIDLYIKSLMKVLKNKYVNAWAHPGRFLAKFKQELSEETLTEIFEIMAREDVLLEINDKYSVPPANWIELARKFEVKMVRGSDAHSIDELSRSDIKRNFCNL